MTTIALNLTTFRWLIVEYENKEKYPDDLIQIFWDHAIRIADNADYGVLAGDSRELMLYLLTAHLMALQANINKGKQGGFVTNSTVDKVSVTKAAPPAPDMFTYWLGQTPRGQELLALCQIATVGGLGIGGLPESSGFRKWGGIF